MVQRLINAITALKRNQKQPTTGQDNKEKVLQSTLIILGRSIQISFHNTLTTANKKKRSKKKNNAPQTSISTPTIHSPSSLSSQSQQSLRTSTNNSDNTTAYSPPRRRKGRQTSSSNDTNVSSPRKGAKTKLMRMSATSESVGLDTMTSTVESSHTTFDNDHRYETTNFLGWRRLHLHEVVRIEVNQSFILVIPSNKQRGENKTLIEQRETIMSRIVSVVLESCSNDYKDVPLASHRKKKAMERLESQHGIKRNGGTYIELPCIVSNHPHQDEYRNEIYSESEVNKHIDQGGGFNIRLINFPCNDSMLIKWSEVNAIQFYVEYYRGDPRPQISLSERRQEYLYCDELTDKLNIVQDDVIQMLELSLAYEKRKNNILKTKLRKALKSEGDMNMKLEQQEQELTNTNPQEVGIALEEELADSCLQNFAHKTDLLYRDALYAHYSNLQSNNRLLNESAADQIFTSIKEQFPLHFLVLESLIFPKYTHQPAHRRKKGYKEKKKALLNHFCALVRVRNPSYLMHWAMVGTLAMWGKGMQLKVYRNPVFKAFSTGLEVTFKYLDRIYEETLPNRVEAMQNLKHGSHASDNYQQWHPFSLQRDNTAGLMHNGMVFNLVMAREYLKPKGTIYLDPAGKKWEVLSSEMPNHWTCVVTLRICAGQDAIEQIEQDERTSEYVRSTMVTPMPCLGWDIESLPNVTPRPPITYVNQEIPSSVHASYDPRKRVGTTPWIGVG